MLMMRSIVFLTVMMIMIQTFTTNAFSLSLTHRRAFLEGAAAVATTAACIITTPSVVMAKEENENDLVMPTAVQTEATTSLSDEEQKMKERLRRKAELQKQASQPKRFTDSFQGEQIKRQELRNMSQEERRNRLCEELGRGC